MKGGVELRVLADDVEQARVHAASGARLPRQVARLDGEPQALHLERLSPAGGLEGCLACGHEELFTQKDFPRSWGIAVVVVAALLAPFTYYLSLVVAAVVDWLLYHGAPNLVACYVCGAQHRGFPPDPPHPRFDREIAERLLWGEKAVMGRPMRPGGTAGAPDPEH